MEITEDAARELLDFGNQTHLSYESRYKLATNFQKNVIIETLCLNLRNK